MNTYIDKIWLWYGTGGSDESPVESRVNEASGKRYGDDTCDTGSGKVAALEIDLRRGKTRDKGNGILRAFIQTA